MPQKVDACERAEAVRISSGAAPTSLSWERAGKAKSEVRGLIIHGLTSDVSLRATEAAKDRNSPPIQAVLNMRSGLWQTLALNLSERDLLAARISHLARLPQFPRPRPTCRRLVVIDTAGGVTAKYRCHGASGRRTSMSAMSPDRVNLVGRDIAASKPFGPAVIALRFDGGHSRRVTE